MDDREKGGICFRTGISGNCGPKCEAYTPIECDPPDLPSFEEILRNPPTGDFHRETAAKLFSVPEEQVTPEQRQWAKWFNFGRVYGRNGLSVISMLPQMVDDGGTNESS